MPQTANIVQLKPRTLEAFEAYIREAEAAMEPSLHGHGAFLWSDTDPQIAQQVRHGDIAAQLWSGDASVKVPNGLIHDWIAAAFIPGTTVADTLALIQNYDNHKNVYQPEVIGSKLISHHGHDFKIFLRLLKKKRCCRPTQVTAFCGVCIPIGVSRSGTTACASSAGPFR